MNLNLLTKTSRQRCGDFVPTTTHTNTPDYNFNWQMLLIHCFTAHLGVKACDYQVLLHKDWHVCEIQITFW